MADDFGFFSSSGNGAPAAEDDPAAAFLAQQESEIAGIENDEAFGTLEEAEQPHYPPSQTNYNVFGEGAATVNGDMFSESNGPTDSYAAIARVDQQRQEPESLRRWREEQRARLEELDSASKAAEAEWKEKAKKELEDWHVHQSEQMEKNKTNNRYSRLMMDTDYRSVLKYSRKQVRVETLAPTPRIVDKAFYDQPNADTIGFVASEEAFVKESDEDAPGSEWERVARLCDFNPKTNKQSKDVSRMRSVLISLKQTPLLR